MVDLKKFAPHFPEQEMTITDLPYHNRPDDPEVLNNLVGISYVLEIIREAVGAPLIINSAYRSYAVNSHPSVGGSKNSYHMKGLAADISLHNLTDSQVLILKQICHKNKIFIVDPRQDMTFQVSETIKHKTYLHVAFNRIKSFFYNN